MAAVNLFAIPLDTWASIWPPASTNAPWHSVTCAVTAVHEMYALPALRLPVNVRHSSKPNISSGPSGVFGVAHGHQETDYP